ncbi:phosphorylase b kinase regulatory subunit beta-like [Lathamus discolor]|uniref:phosphorylase b kinase regulatory subunit beta-like n=1 Tax=Lathamus discolor TaxID=678569 RepID=UPI0032B72029
MSCPAYNLGGVTWEAQIAAQTLISGAVVEQLDFVRIAETEEVPVIKRLEELDFPKHSKFKRQSGTPNASELEQQPDVVINDWKNKSTYEILQKFNVRKLAKKTV